MFNALKGCLEGLKLRSGTSEILFDID